MDFDRNKIIQSSPVFGDFTIKKSEYNPALHKKNEDSISLNTLTNPDAKNLHSELIKTKEQQGLIGNLWDGFKNLTKIGASSNKVENAIKQLNNGEISKEEAQQILTNYQDGQKTCLDVVADMISSIVAVGAFAMAVPTGGTSLPVGLAISTGISTILKVGIKGIDAKTNGREYNSKNLLYDVVTGSVNGLLAPVTNGIGSSLTKTIGCKLGLEITGDVLEAGAKSTLKNLIVNQSIDVAGGTLKQRALALGAGMAIDGALGGAADNTAREIIDDKKDKNILKAATEGFFGGLIMSPVIGGGFRLAGKLGSKLGKKLFPNSNKTPDLPNNPFNQDTKLNPDVEVKPEPSVEIKPDAEPQVKPTVEQKPKQEPNIDVKPEVETPAAGTVVPKPEIEVNNAPTKNPTGDTLKPKGDAQSETPSSQFKKPSKSCIQSEDVQKARIAELTKMNNGRRDTWDGKISDELIEKIAREYSEERYNLFVRLNNLKDSYSLYQVPRILDKCDDESAKILLDLLDIKVESSSKIIHSSVYQFDIDNCKNAVELNKEQLFALRDILQNQSKSNPLIPSFIIDEIKDLNKNQLEIFKRIINIEGLASYEQYSAKEAKKIAQEMPIENLEYVEKFLNSQKDKNNARNIKKVIEDFSKCTKEEVPHLEKVYEFLMSEEIDRVKWDIGDFPEQATDKELELAKKLLAMKNSDGEYIISGYYDSGILNRESLTKLFFDNHSQARYELLDELLKYPIRKDKNNISDIFRYLDDEQAAFVKRNLYIEGRSEQQQFYNDFMCNLAHIKKEGISLLEDNGLLYIPQRGESQFNALELAHLSKLDEVSIQNAKKRGLFAQKAAGKDHLMSAQSIAELAKIPDANWEKAQSLIHIPQRGDYQFSVKEITKLSELDTIQFAKAKDFLYVENREMQFNADSILELIKLDEKQINIAKERGLLLNSNYGGKSICELISLSDSDYNRIKPIIDNSKRKFNGEILNNFAQQLSEEEAKKVPTLATILDDGYINENREQFSADEIISLAKLPQERYEKISQFFNFEDRKNFEHSEIIKLLDLSDKEIETVKKLAVIPDRGRFFQFDMDTLIALAKLPKEKLENLSSFFHIDGRIDLDSSSILKLTTLNNKELKVAQSLAVIPERGDYGQFYGEDLIALAKLSSKELDKARKYFKIEGSHQLNANTIIMLQRYEGVKSFDALTISQKRTLLKDLIKENNKLFRKNCDYMKIADCGIIPRNKEEYCSLIPRLVKSIGISTNELASDVKKGFYEAMSSIEKPNSKFRSFNFENPNLRIGLAYPRKQFVADIAEILKPLTKEQRNIVCNYFGFEIISKENKHFMNGYPVNLNNGVELAKINDSYLKQIIEQMRPLVKKFSEENFVSIKGEPELSKEINDIVKAFPEFITEIGKKQHHTHDYTLDIHSLKVLQGVINNPKYEQLPDKDKFALKIAALLHDITKQENLRDALHPQESAYDAYYLLDKLKLSEDEKLQIYQIIKDHNWLQRYNVDDANQRIKVAKDIAFDLRKGNSFEMASILTEADMQAVKRDGKFFAGYSDILKRGEKEVGDYVKQIKESAIHLPQTKLPKASELIVDGDKVKEIITKGADGREIKNKVLYLEPEMDLSKYGFAKGLNSNDLNVLIHALETGQQSTIFQALGQIDSDALLSTSYVNYEQGNFHAFRQQGFILDVDSDDINAGYYRDFGSGYAKTLDILKEKYLFDGSLSNYRKYCSGELKKLLNMDGAEYSKFYEQIKNMSITEIEEKYPDAGAVFKEFFKKMEGGKRAHGRQYNEMLVTRPKIQGVFDYGKSKDISKIPEFLRVYAAENDLPIIYFGQ